LCWYGSHEFVFGKVELRWKKVRATRKDKDEEKEEESCRKILVELFLAPKVVPQVCFM
jgi:hypothetical protein